MSKILLWTTLHLAAAAAGRIEGGKTNFRFTTPEQRAAFERDGFVVVRGLLNQTTVESLVAGGDSAFNDGMKDHQRKKAEGKAAAPETNNVQATRVALTPSIFQDVALFSDIPNVVSELMQLDRRTQTLRLIHDFFFSRDINDQKVCDWHVDGHGLWPESYETPSEASKISGKDQDGINAWIALDDMPAEFQGSMALSAGSHRVPWRYDAYRAIGRDGTANGGETWEDLVDRTASGTSMVAHPEQGPRIRLCSIGVTAPDLYQKLEERKRVLDLRAGDVVFCSRHLFHRTLQVTDAGREYYPTKLGRCNLHRYTIRYTTGSAVLPTGFCWMEWSIVTNPSIAGLTLDEVANKEPAPYWFPKVWPSKPDDIHQRLQELVPHVAAAKEKLKAVSAKLSSDVAAVKASKTAE